MKRVGKLRAQDKAYAEGAYKVAKKAVVVDSKAKPLAVGKVAAMKAVLKTRPGKIGAALVAIAAGKSEYDKAKKKKTPPK